MQKSYMALTTKLAVILIAGLVALALLVAILMGYSEAFTSYIRPLLR